MSFKEKIYNGIKGLGGGSHTMAEIAKTLRLSSRNERKILRYFIDELIKEGRIASDGRGKVSLSYNRIVEGELKGNRRGFAFLLRDDGEDIFIPNRALNGAMHGDTVSARLTGESEGEVISIEKRGIVKLVGTFFKLDRHGYVTPDNSDYFKDIFVPFENSKDAPHNSKVVVSLKSDFKNMKITGTVEEILGISGERDAEVLSILKSYDFSDKFPKNVILASQNIKYEEVEGRKDLRDLLTVTIDGEDAKDFDDAISLEKTGNGYRLYVHIADVSHYVKPGGALDREALERGTSVYFPGSVYPMLPEALSNGVCSLRPGEDKLTVTVVMDIDRYGNVTGSEFYKSMIRSDYRLTYTAVTAVLKGDPELTEHYAGIKELLFDAAELAKILTEKRNSGGAINFESRESKILIDKDGKVVDIARYPYDISNNIIEQFMVLANETVARYISNNKLPSVYRVHGAPADVKLKGFLDFIGALGYKLNLFNGITPKVFSDFLESVKGDPAESVINKYMLRSMQKAKYSMENTGHFGLNSQFYCHFTSPIRRYPDLMVHRVLKAIIEGKADAEFKEKFKKLCAEAAERSSERELAAERAERDIDDYYKAVYMSDKLGKEYDGIVSGVVSQGLFVELDNTVEGFIPVSELPTDRYGVDARMRLSGDRFIFSIGDPIKVIIKSVVLSARQINMSFYGKASDHLKRPIAKKARQSEAAIIKA